MGNLFLQIGIDQNLQNNLPEDVKQSEEVLEQLNQIYANAPEGPQKDRLAIAISEGIRMVLKEAEKFKPNPNPQPQVQPQPLLKPQAKKRGRPKLIKGAPSQPSPSPQAAAQSGSQPKPQAAAQPSPKPSSQPSSKAKSGSKPGSSSQPNDPCSKYKNETATIQELEDSIDAIIDLIGDNSTTKDELDDLRQRIQCLKSKKTP